MRLDKLRKLIQEQRRLKANSSQIKAKKDTEGLPTISRPSEGSVTAQFVSKKSKK